MQTVIIAMIGRNIWEDKLIVDELRKKLSEPPTKKIDELPIITNTLTLPFDKLKWEDFEKFCFQLGSSYMDCLETSYIYGRLGQKQEGIDIYFNNEGNINVWQIKRYNKFTRKDIQNAVEMFLEGKWKDEAKVFTLCVSNYLNDTGIVDEISEKAKLLSQYGIIFSVLNSEKLTIKAKSYPLLVNDFFGKHWSEAMGLVASKDNSNNITNNKSTWFNEATGAKIDPDKIYEHGNFKTKIDGDIVYIEHKLPNGNTTYCEFDIKANSVKNIRCPYPLCEYKLDIPPELILREESGNTIIQGKVYQAKIIHLKWGKRIILLFDQSVLIDIDINTKTFIDNNNKIIHVYDLADTN